MPKPPRRPKATEAVETTTPAVDETPVRTDNGPRDIDPVQNISQDPGLDYSAHSDPAYGPVGADEDVA